MFCLKAASKSTRDGHHPWQLSLLFQPDWQAIYANFSLDAQWLQQASFRSE
jgi:hypothetical protein